MKAEQAIAPFVVVVAVAVVVISTVIAAAITAAITAIIAAAADGDDGDDMRLNELRTRNLRNQVCLQGLLAYGTPLSVPR